MIIDRLEVFLYQTANSGGSYETSIRQKEAIIDELMLEQKKCKIEYLQSKGRIEHLLKQADRAISFSDLNASYLMGDFREVLSCFPKSEQAKIEVTLNNALTRMMFYKTELDHLTDIHAQFKNNKDHEALSALHIKRNYSLSQLFEQEILSDKIDASTIEHEFKKAQKMQRATLLFEYEFGHRCNARQIDVFHGLLLDDDLIPIKLILRKHEWDLAKQH